MKILINTLTIIVAAGVGLVVGFAWRGKSGSVATAVPSQASVPALTSTSPASPLHRASTMKIVRANDDTPLATQLEHDLSMSSGVTRWLYWLEAIEKAVLPDFPRLARLANGNTTAARLLAARWVELDPRHLFDTIVAARDGRGFPSGELDSVLLAEWPKRDPDAVIAALSGTNYFGPRSSWRMTIVGSLIEKDAERGLRLMSEWHIHNFFPRMTGIAKWAADDPRHAAEFALANPAGSASQAAMETIGKEWARTDPARAMEFAAAKPGGLGSTLANSILKNWAGRNLNEAADWLADADASTRSRLSPAFVEAWAKHDAGGALAWCEANLTGSSMAQAVGGLSKGAAESDVIGAAGLVTDMKPSSARAEAAAGVAQKWFPDSSSGKPVPPEAIEWIKSLDADSVKRVLEQVHFRWRDSDPKGMAAFLASTDSEQIPERIYSELARNLARQNPMESLEWASRLPEERGLSAGSEAFSEWRRSQPEAAMKWLNDLPSADPRHDPYLQNAIRSLVYEPQAAEQLIALNSAERTTARGIIAKMNLSEDRRAKLLDALKPR